MSKVNLIVRWIWTKFGPSGLGREVVLTKFEQGGPDREEDLVQIWAKLI